MHQCVKQHLYVWSSLPWWQVSGDEGWLTSHGAHLLLILIPHHVCRQTVQKLLFLLFFLWQKTQRWAVHHGTWWSPAVRPATHQVVSCMSQVDVVSWCWHPSLPSAASSVLYAASWPHSAASADGCSACSPVSPHLSLAGAERLDAVFSTVASGRTGNNHQSIMQW